MSNNKNSKKIKILLILSGIILFVFAFFPTLARYKHRTSYYELTEWDGTVASKYRSGSGTEVDPYIISNGSEFAYFAKQLEHTNYSGVYFELGNDIVLNKGIFDYDGIISYTLDDSIYEITEFTGEYSEGNVNKFSKMKEFNGHLDGNLYRIYGLYMTSKTENDLALFDSIGGSISNLYITNSIIYGGNNTSMLAINSNDASIKNVMIDGYVIGKNDNMITEYDIDSITTGNTINLSSYNYQGTYISSTLTGTFTSTENNKLIINGTEYPNGEFKVNLNENSDIEYSLLTEDTYTLSNLKYTITTNHGVSSGFIINSNNTTLNTVVNKSSVIGKNNASGFIYSSSGILKLENGYNAGNIESNITSGLINYVNSGEVTINSFYNNLDLTGSFIYSVSSGKVNILNSFTAGTGYVIDTVNSDVNVTNSYAINSATIKNGEISGKFTTKDIGSLKNNQFIKNDLQYKEFISIADTLVNKDNIWVFEDESYPILYIDDLNRPVAKINVSIYSWDTLASDLDTHKFASDFMFNITTTDALAEVKNIEYYLHKSMTPLEDYKTAEYTKYENEMNINEEGSYIIYAKITDKNDKITYINSDILIINPENTIANVTIGENKYSSIKSVPRTIYLSKNDNIKVNINEEYVDIENISYYISTELIEEKELEQLSEVWTQYTKEIEVNSNENNIYYFKVIDNNGNETYISTDYITVDGYTMNDIVVGREKVESGVSVSNVSRIKLNYTYVDSNIFVDGYTHNIVSNVLLPEKTEITLIDNKNNKIYKYKTTNESYGYNESNKKATYPLTLFSEIGKIDKTYLNESIYSGQINESFEVIIDLKNTNIKTNIEDVTILLEVNDSEGNKVIPTLDKDIKTFNINTESYELEITSNFTGNVNYNKDNSSSVDFKIKIKDNSIIDSTLQDKKYGLEIKMIDNNTSSLLGKEYLSNVQFKYNDNVYVPYSNGKVHINLEKETERKRTEQSFFVPKAEIVSNNYDLSINKYKEIVYEKVEYPAPKTLIAEIKSLQNEIATDLAELEKMLGE